jgi:hypothetical protein
LGGREGGDGVGEKKKAGALEELAPEVTLGVRAGEGWPANLMTHPRKVNSR